MLTKLSNGAYINPEYVEYMSSVSWKDSPRVYVLISGYLLSFFDEEARVVHAFIEANAEEERLAEELYQARQKEFNASVGDAVSELGSPDGEPDPVTLRATQVAQLVLEAPNV